MNEFDHQAFLREAGFGGVIRRIGKQLVAEKEVEPRPKKGEPDEHVVGSRPATDRRLEPA